MAMVLTAGIVQDTHTFSHPNVTPRTLRVAADLVEAGAPLSAIHRVDLRRQAVQHPRAVGPDPGRAWGSCATGASRMPP